MIVTPLIAPLLIWGAVALFGVFGVAGIAGVWKDPKKNKLGILGMQISGKTRLLSYLRNEPYVDKRTGRDSYEEFTHKLDNGKKIYITPGKDIGGGEVYRVDYDQIIDTSDVILYLFDIDKYLRNEIDLETKLEYQRACNSRFEHIYSKVKNSKKPVVIIATHKDKCNLSEGIMKLKFDTIVNNKSYKPMFKDVEYVNLTNNSEMKKLASKIFNEK